MSLTKEEGETLLQVARQSIEFGLDKGKPLLVEARDYVEALRPVRATFVTLEIQNNLRGCIGTLVASYPLVTDVAYHAYAAAFSDPRFPKLQDHELPLLDVHISILNEAEPMSFDSEADLIGQLRPGVDGLILSDGPYRGTFLPSVWESLTEPQAFFQHLKQKAGLPPNHWSKTLKVERYTVESIH
jgi:uncharacterized protein